MAINKVVYGGNTLIDITGTTATASDVANGKVFFAADGTQTTGTASGGAVVITDTTDPAGGTIREITTAEEVLLQSKRVASSTADQTVTPDTGYTALSSVEVTAMESLSGLTLDTITASTDSFPSPAVGDTGATAFGKIVKFFADALSAIQAKLDAANVVNNLTTTAAGYALDARQGKAINDSLANYALRSSLNWSSWQQMYGGLAYYRKSALFIEINVRYSQQISVAAFSRVNIGSIDTPVNYVYSIPLVGRISSNAGGYCVFEINTNGDCTIYNPSNVGLTFTELLGHAVISYNGAAV